MYLSRERRSIKLMSPLRTFQSSGSSSRLVERRKRPKAVRRMLSGNRLPSVSRASVMVRNLSILNGFPCKPRRTWVKKIGEPSFSRTNTIKISNSGENNSSAKKVAVQLVKCFIVLIIGLLNIGYRKPLKTRHIAVVSVVLSAFC